MNLTTKILTRLFSLSILIQFCFTQGPSQSKMLRGIYTFGEAHLDYKLMRDSLHINSYQTSTDMGESMDERDSMLKNAGNLLVINQVRTLSRFCRAQRIVYLAKADEKDPVMNHFGYKNKASESADGGEGVKIVAPGKTGYFVSAVAPNNFYKSGSKYVATFRLKVAGQYDAGNEVAECQVFGLGSGSVLESRTLHGSDFPKGSVYYPFTVDFTAPEATGSPSVDMRVLWHGKVTTYVDSVFVDDLVSDSLFSGRFDAEIESIARKFSPTIYPLTEGFYLYDEPQKSNFLAMGYVAGRIKKILGNELHAGCATAQYHDYTRYLSEAAPEGIFHDPYFLHPNIPDPSIHNDTLAALSGILAWDPVRYLDSLQNRIDGAVQKNFRPMADAVKAAGYPVVISAPQMCGRYSTKTRSYNTGTIYDLRPPSASELRLEYGLGMAYGAHGFMPYKFATDSGVVGSGPWGSINMVSLKQVGGYYTDHSSNIDTILGKPVWAGYTEKWNEFAALNKRLESIGDTLFTLKWESAKSWSQSTDESTAWSPGIVSNVETRDIAGASDRTPYVVVGRLRRETTDYLVVLNRRCADSDSRMIKLTLDVPGAESIKVTNIENAQVWTVKNGGTFEARFRPGESLIFRVNRM